MDLAIRQRKCTVAAQVTQTRNRLSSLVRIGSRRRVCRHLPSGLKRTDINGRRASRQQYGQGSLEGTEWKGNLSFEASFRGIDVSRCWQRTKRIRDMQN